MTVNVALGSDRVEAPSAPQWVGWLLAAGQCLLAISLAWQWLCVSTYRLHLGADTEQFWTAIPLVFRDDGPVTEGGGK